MATDFATFKIDVRYNSLDYGPFSFSFEDACPTGVTISLDSDGFQLAHGLRLHWERMHVLRIDSQRAAVYAVIIINTTRLEFMLED